MVNLKKSSAIVFVIVVAVVGYFVFGKSNVGIITHTGNKLNESFGNGGVSWQFDMEKGDYLSSSTPPDCQEPLIFPSPVDVNLATGILYPGQIRGGDYKPHGGFRFDNRVTNDIEVRAIMDGYVLKASKYRDAGEVQALIFFANDCGIMVMHDHLLTLSSKLEKVLESVPVGGEDDSRTTNIEQKTYFKKGELLAIEIGYRNYPGGYKDKNIFVDFGLYDLRETNGVNYSKAFRFQHTNINEYGTHALCWFDNLGEPDKSIVKSLPGSDSTSGANSDYCK